MKKVSITLRITLWYSLLMLLLVLLMLGFMLSISDSIIQSNAESRLDAMVKSNADEVEYDDGELEIDKDFEFYSNGVSSLVYTDDLTLVEGRLPDGFPPDTPFIDGEPRLITAGGERFLVHDRMVTSKKYPAIWVRGVLPLDAVSGITDALYQITLFASPLLVVLAAVGGYLITKRAFRPVRMMNLTVASITEGKDLSRRVEIEEGQDEIHALANNFNGMLQRLESAFEAEKQFVSDVSHELRTPVSVIMAQCEYALGQASPDGEARESLEVVQRQAERMHRLITHLLMITRLEQGQLSIALQDTDLSALLESLGEEAAIWAPEHITLKHDIPAGIRAAADASLLARVYQNLMQNAVKYAASTVSVALRAEEGMIRLTVADDGIGIAPAEQEKIWRRFYQVNPSRTANATESMGLGLFIVKQIALLHQGGVTLQSKPGEGSTFSFVFPQKPPAFM